MVFGSEGEVPGKSNPSPGNRLAEIRQGMDLLFEPGQTYELRVPKARIGKGRPRTLSGFFNNLDLMAQAVLDLDGKAPGIFATINPVCDDLRALAENKVNHYPESTASDKDIPRLRSLLIDIDSVRHSGVSATQEEYKAAEIRTRSVLAFLRSRQFPESVIASSGNGFNLRYKVNLPNDEASNQLLRRVLEALDLFFSDEQVKIDVATFNPSRLAKVYGTLAAKGDNTVERPHRRSRVLQAPSECQEVSRELLAAVAEEAPQPQAKSGQQQGDWVDVIAECAKHDLKAKEKGMWNGARRHVIEPCPFDDAHKELLVLQYPSSDPICHCPHTNCEGYKWRPLHCLLEPAGDGSDTSAAGQPDHSVSVDSRLAGAIRSIAIQEGLAAFDKRRSIARLIQDHLASAGECFHTPDNRGFFFHQPERRIYDIDSQAFERLVAAASGLSLTETFFQFAVDQLRTHVLRNSRVSRVHTLAHYSPDSGIMAVSDSGSGIWIREKGCPWQERHNGDDGIFFAVDDDATPWQPEFRKREALRWFLDQLLFANHELSIEDSKTLTLVWLLQQFFPELRRTRLVPCFLGPQGSGKSTAVRLIGRLLVGSRFEVTGIRRDKEDAFVAAVTNRVVLGLDNADSRIPWLPDALATYATGQRYRLRKLYSTNEELAYTPRSILLISSRDPRFNRADVVERLLPLYFERPTLYHAESEIFSELERRRGAIMGALLSYLGETADALAIHPAKSLSFRMADFAAFGERIFAARETSSQFLDLLARLERVQARFAAEADGLVEALRLLLEQERIEDISVGDLFRKCRKIAEDNGLSIARSAQGFGRHLSNMRRVIELELQVRLLESAPHARYRRISLVPANDSKPTSEPINTEESHGTN